EDVSETRRLRAIEYLIWDLKASVHNKCDPSLFRNYEGDDAYDPVIDYEHLRGEPFVFAWRANGDPEMEDEADVWLCEAPFNWAAQDALHAEISRDDVHMQEHLARGGDPKPVARIRYVDID
ncbi:hypothetical protein BD626DRAFT_411078, partial [Schizophyllum amplum]